MRGSAQKFTDSKLSSGLSSCHCAQDFVQIVWRFYFVATRETLHTAYKTVAKGGVMKQRFQVRSAFVRNWYSGVQEKNKDQQVATIVQDRTMKLEEVSSSP